MSTRFRIIWKEKIIYTEEVSDEQNRKPFTETERKGEKAFITYMTAGLPDTQGMKDIMRAQEEAGVDIIELGIPFSDPVADGPVIQEASYRSILKGTNLNSVFQAVGEAREEGLGVPIVFMMYYNTVLHYGLEKFAGRCAQIGVDGLIIPDLPYEEQGTAEKCTDEGGRSSGDYPARITAVQAEDSHDSGRGAGVRVLRFVNGSDWPGSSVLFGSRSVLKKK